MVHPVHIHSCHVYCPWNDTFKCYISSLEQRWQTTTNEQPNRIIALGEKHIQLFSYQHRRFSARPTPLHSKFEALEIIQLRVAWAVDEPPSSAHKRRVAVDSGDSRRHVAHTRNASHLKAAHFGCAWYARGKNAFMLHWRTNGWCQPVHRWCFVGFTVEEGAECHSFIITFSNIGVIYSIWIWIPTHTN